MSAPVLNTAVESAALPSVAMGCSVSEWLQNQGRYCDDVPTLLGEVARRLCRADVPLHRCGFVLRTLHPLILGGAYIWQADAESVRTVEISHESLQRDAYLKSPVRLIFEGSPGIRRRLADADCPRDFPILDDLDAEGVTDYLALPLPFSDGRNYAAHFATKAPGGFADDQITLIMAQISMLAMVVEILSVRQVTTNLVDTYLGHKTGERVLNGAIRRGSNETLQAAIWYSDLRGFTAMTDRLPTDVLLGILNDHFERVVAPIHRHGGEVLKFVGDGTLAIFPLADLGGAGNACAAALAAVKEAARETTRHNAKRRAEDLPEIHYGVALHLGAVTYGNIGAPDRLDFTVIGPAVNQAARIETQCRTMGRHFLTSAAFAEAANVPLLSLGVHALRGVREPQELFTLPERPI